MEIKVVVVDKMRWCRVRQERQEFQSQKFNKSGWWCGGRRHGTFAQFFFAGIIGWFCSAQVLHSLVPRSQILLSI